MFLPLTGERSSVRYPKIYNEANWLAGQAPAAFSFDGTLTARWLSHAMKITSRPLPPPKRGGEDGRNTARQNFQRGNLILSSLPPKADMCSALADVRFVPTADMEHRYRRGQGCCFSHQPPDVLALFRDHGCAAQNPHLCRPPMSNLNCGQNDGAYNFAHGCRPATGGISAAIRYFKSSEGVHRSPILSCVRRADVAGSH